MTSPAFVLAIPGFFKSSLDCFQYVQFGRAFHRDFAFCVAKLQAAEMEFTRWGEAMGVLNENADAASRFQQGFWKESELLKAEIWLQTIQDAFETARRKSEQFRGLSMDDGDKKQDLEVLDATQELENSDKPLKGLIDGMRTIAIKGRRKLQETGRRTRWALYRKTDFNSLIDSICEAVDTLVKLFPSVQPQHNALCAEEAGHFKPQAMQQLLELLGNHDQLLRDALLNRARQRAIPSPMCQ
ncbi:Heterokaryon incompatibility protein s [Colletotrichum siamense]|uniref:Heterokaryon incompatibility protein s n=1 Tax=Colletotrichum siamense TaxID=690259 RepID=A0A9P5EFC4_COLSI|nr:Heterokaryon incompatibility protein s [Colletotrichum siamense]KAF4848828.1 Heterokaryon incompatibility protein s [Colletotrichum siamense]